MFSGGHAPVVQRLLELPKDTIDYGAVNDKGQTGMDVAKEEGHTAILKMFANAGHCEIVFWIACTEGKEDDLRKTLLEREDIVKSCGAVGFRIACQYGQLAIVNLFLEEPTNVIDITAKNYVGNNGFILACRGKVLVLIFCGIEIDVSIHQF